MGASTTPHAAMPESPQGAPTGPSTASRVRNEAHLSCPLAREGFRGSADWVHALEGHAGDLYGRSAYYPGGRHSGVTLDPGVDLAHARRSLVVSAYRPYLTPRQMRAVEQAMEFGFRGEQAALYLEESPALRSIRLTRAEASHIFPLVAAPYWRRIAQRFPALLREDVPSEAHTVMLSLAFNRGPHNAALDALAPHIAAGDYEAAADVIAAMQDEHELQGITDRRDREAEHLRDGIDEITAHERAMRYQQLRIIAQAVRRMDEEMVRPLADVAPTHATDTLPHT